MKTIFISYAREDRDQAAALARALTDRGFKVWWDWNLIGGDNFRQTIRAELERADKVIVIWSEASATSSFVIDEVSAARRQNKLVPTHVDDALPPFGFGDLHTLPLTAEAHDLDAIAAAIESKPVATAPRSTSRKAVSRSILAGMALAVAAATTALIYFAFLLPKREVFDSPKTASGIRIDHCLHWARECGEPAATHWCRSQGFRRSFDYQTEGGVPPTFVLGDSRICELPVCTAFKTIVCEK